MYNPSNQQAIQSYLANLSDKLAQTILQLQSDQVIEQMRNDKTLYQYKLTHIKELIEEYFNFGEELNELVEENGRLKESLAVMEQKLGKKDQEFKQAMEIIQDGAKKHTRLKEEEISRLNGIIKELQSKLNDRHDANSKASKKTSQLSITIQNLQEENQKIMKQLKQYKEELTKLSQINKKLKLSQKQSDNDHQKSINLLKTQYQKQIHQYENMTKKMQNDMLIIKTQWQKKCSDVERQLREFYEGQMIKLQEKKNRELLQHLQAMKQGKPVIIKQDQDIMTSRVESIRRQYQIQIEKLQKNNQQLHQLYQNLQSSHIPKARQIQTLSDALKNVRNEFEIEKQNWSSQKQKSKREIEKLKAIVLQFERNNKDAILNSQAKQSQITKLNDNIKFIEKKLDIANRNVTEQKNVIAQREDQLQILKTKYHNLEDLNKKMKKNIDQLEADMEIKTKKIDIQIKQLDKLNEKYTESVQSNNQLKTQIKSLKQFKQKVRKTIDKIFIQLKHNQKQLTLLKQDVKYMCELHRKKHFTQLQKLIDQIQAYRQNVQKDSKNRMNELINEIEQAKEAEHAEFENVLRERQNLKRQVAELQDLFAKKEREVDQAKRNILNAQTDQVRRTMIQQLQRERIKYQRLEEDLISAQKNHHKILQKTKGQVKDAIKVLTNKWMEDISKLEQDNKKKQFQLQRIIQKVQTVISQSQQTKSNYQTQKQQCRKIRKKYETLKQQKQQQINDLIKRLERQSQHKINLQKQLRNIRTQLNKVQKNSKEYIERENRTFGNTLVTDREKQFTDIRELIAQTYQIAERPERDNRLDRKRSPY